MGECPVCALEIRAARDSMRGDYLICDDCGAELEIVSLSPLKLVEVPISEDDWSD